MNRSQRDAQLVGMRRTWKQPEGLHCCEPELGEAIFPCGGYGAAIDICLEKDSGELWVSNGEYETRANYCPFCGYKAKLQITW